MPRARQLGREELVEVDSRSVERELLPRYGDAADKEIVSPLRAKLCVLMMRIFIPLQGENSQRWLPDDKIPWRDPQAGCARPVRSYSWDAAFPVPR